MKRKLSKPFFLFGTLLLLFLLLILWLILTNVRFTVTHYTIESPHLPPAFAGYRIAHISDLHNHPWGARLTDRLRAEKPDLIAVTGDLVDSRHTDYDTALAFIREAVTVAPVFYVSGNHEARLRDYPRWETRLREAGAVILDDSTQVLTRQGAEISVTGIRDPDFEADPWIREAVVARKLEEHMPREGYRVVLCHRPELFEVYAEAGAHLVLTGHAHGGQVRLPFIGGLAAPDQGLFPKYTEGVYTRGQTRMEVSRGLGNSIAPIRVNNTPELVILTLEPEKAP